MVVPVLAWPAVLNAAPAGETVTVPWREFRDLYRGEVERQLRGEPEPKRPVVSIEKGEYRLDVGEETAAGAVVLTGRVIGPGAPDPVPLFPPGTILARVGDAEGGALVCTSGGIAFHPTQEGPFRLALDLRIAVTEDERSRVLSLPVPAAAVSAVRVSLPAEHRLVGRPGIPGADGDFHFSSARPLTVRFERRPVVPPSSAPEIDTFTRVMLRGNRVVLVTAFLPARAPAGPVTVRLPAGATWQATSLPGSRIRERDGERIVIALPPDKPEPFVVQVSLPGGEGEAPVAFAVPVVESNTGREGEFALESPRDGEVSFEGAVPAPPWPARLAGRAESLVGEVRGRRLRVPRDAPARMRIRRYAAVEAPEVVLDDLYFCTAFEEGGGALSVLRLEVPPAAGPRLRLRRVAGAEIWSAVVNGRKTGVYTRGEEGWILPLAEGEVSRIELTFLVRGAKLGLQGRLVSAMPATGLPARNVHVAVILPARVQLVSVEGDLTAEPGASWEVPGSLRGSRYFFRRAFDAGEGVEAAFFYKEPVEGRMP
jgi:hypothetical protein